MTSLLTFLANFSSLYFLIILMKSTHIKTDKDADAKAIIDSKFDPKTVASILLFRTQEECSAINQAIAELNGGKPLVDPKYVPLRSNKPYDDLLFALVNEPMTIFSQYLGVYLENKDETLIIIIFIQIEDREGFKEVYNKQHERYFDKDVEAQRSPFMNALRVWCRENRQQDASSECFTQSGACVSGKELIHERKSWKNKKRDNLEFILMKEGMGDAKISIRCYGIETEVDPNLLNDINHHIDNHDLVDLYTSLVNYIQNRESYLASLLHKYCDGTEGWTVWILILTIRRGDGVNAIDGEFQKLNTISLMDYIKTCNVADAQLKDMLTVLVDPESASKRQVPPPPPPAEPPCQPTIIASSTDGGPSPPN